MPIHKNLTDALLYAYQEYVETRDSPIIIYELELAISNLTRTIAHNEPNADCDEYPITICKRILDDRQKRIEDDKAQSEATQ